ICRDRQRDGDVVEGVFLPREVRLDAIEELLGDADPYLFGAEPCVADASVFGLAGPMVLGSVEAPVWQYAGTLPALGTFCEHVLAEYFPEWAGDSDAATRSVNHEGSARLRGR
ncbi:MAG: glutathione S-transferase C-terminal domain-containing protein, partial [Bradymonadaceae bacterium]